MVMNEMARDGTPSTVETHSRELLLRSVESLDLRVVSRLTQARHSALDAAARPRPWFLQMRVWTPAAGITCAALLGAALWLGMPSAHHSTAADTAPSLEDLDIVASSDEGSGDAMEMLQNDIDFYDFAEKDATSVPAANSGPAA